MGYIHFFYKKLAIRNEYWTGGKQYEMPVLEAKKLRNYLIVIKPRTTKFLVARLAMHWEICKRYGLPGNETLYIIIIVNS